MHSKYLNQGNVFNLTCCCFRVQTDQEAGRRDVFRGAKGSEPEERVERGYKMHEKSLRQH